MLQKSSSNVPISVARRAGIGDYVGTEQEDEMSNAEYAYARGRMTARAWIGPHGDGSMGNLSIEHLNRVADESGDAAAWWRGWDRGWDEVAQARELGAST